MDADEQDICNFLKAWPQQFISSREICRRAGGKRRFREDPFWAKPILLRMVEKDILATDAAGYYCLIPEHNPRANTKPKRWVSPQIKKLLQAKGGQFAEVVYEIEEPEDSEDSEDGVDGVDGVSVGPVPQ